jgi:UDP-4-amino-4-deoxy-L-arabinose formyltransferase/UDP-glucuronic acid dehydrogenase (UDP-4-keto-hexauronic acid decarboxylating)
MRIAIIGRSEYLYESALLLLKNGYEIPLIITSKESPEFYFKASDFENLASQHGAAYFYSPNIALPEIKNLISMQPKTIDLAVSINYTGIISQEVIDLFPMGILNAHGGDLPRYRGNACMAWAILNDEKKVALCIHKMIGGELDSGNIICRKYKALEESTRIGQLFDWMRTEIPPMMLEAVQLLEKNPDYILEVQSKNPANALRTYPRLPEDGKIHWHHTNKQIIKLVNASSEPFSGAFCIFKNEILKIWRAENYFDDENYLAIPGQIAQLNPDGSIIVITGSGKIKVTDVEFKDERKKPTAVIKSIRQRLT